jgi:MYXO-CTERM domain-containing protein
MPRSLLRWSLVLGVVLSSATALASDPYPAAIAQKLSVPAPPCTICHLTLIGGAMTVTKAFGRTAMDTYGLAKLNPTQLMSILTEMETDGVDSDGDGIGDIAELRAGTDPNDGPGASSVEPPRYGLYCSTGATSGRSTIHGLWWLGAAAVWLGRRRTKLRRAVERKDVV